MSRGVHWVRTTHDKVRLSDGREGYQSVDHFSDGGTELAGLTVTKTAEGESCRVVYSRKSDLMAHVYSLSSIGNGVTWEIIEKGDEPDDAA